MLQAASTICIFASLFRGISMFICGGADSAGIADPG